MTPEELAAKIAELEARAQAAETTARQAQDELARRFPSPADPDEPYKPKTWRDLDEKVDRKAEEAALKVLKEAEERKQKEREKEEELVAEQERRIDEAFRKLQEEGVIEETRSQDDKGAWQRRQILGSLVRSGGQHVDVEARKLRSAWDAGLEYDHEQNSFRRMGSGPSSSRDQFVASSASRVQQPSAPGKIDLRGTRGDLDLARERWEAARGRA